jgi:HK97 family phage portal protein
MHAIHGLSWNGYSALEAIVMGREAIALAAATEESQARLHGQGVRPGGIVSTKEGLSDEQVEKVRADFAANYQGLDNAFATLLLDFGLEFKPWAMTGVDSQHLETRCHQIEECCRFLRVFPAIIGYADKTTTFASAEQFFLAHVVHTLQPWFTLWEQAIGRDLLTEREHAAGLYSNFVMQGLMRGDAKSRSEYYKNGITDGWLTRNDARRFEDLNPLPGLDVPLIMANMTDGSKPPKPAPAPAPPAV